MHRKPTGYLKITGNYCELPQATGENVVVLVTSSLCLLSDPKDGDHGRKGR